MADVVVVGGGPAGAASALVLARAGLAVTVLERTPFPRRKVCGEYLSTGAVAALERLGLLADLRPHAVRLHGVRLVAAAAEATLPFPGGALAMPRALLDDLLLEAARRAGAEIVLGRAESLLRAGDRVVGVRARDAHDEPFELPARWTIGADGCGSLVARAAGLARSRPRRARFALGGHYAGTGVDDAHVEMYLGDGAYFALNPLGGGLANAMAVVPRHVLTRWSDDVDAALAAHAARLSRGRRELAVARRQGARVAVGPLEHDVRTAAAPGVLLVGDAAGFVDPFTGQGVFLALTSALAAAEAVRACAAAPGREARTFGEYGRRQAARIRGRRQLGAGVAVLVDVAPLARRAAANLARRPRAAAALADLVAGVGGAQRGLDPALLGARPLTVSETALEIAAPPAAIYRYAAATERWPEWLPHYRFVRVLEERDGARVIEMGAWRDCFPLRWRALQTNDPTRPHVAFRHLAGPVRGMDVEWLFEPLDGGRTRVTIVHRLQFRFPFAADWLGERVVAGYFIEGVARRTLARMKQLAEAEG